MKPRRVLSLAPAAAAVVICAAAAAAPSSRSTARAAAKVSSTTKLRLPSTNAGRTIVQFGGAVAFPTPSGWVRRQLGTGHNPNSDAEFRLPVGAGCSATAIAFPDATASAMSARAQLRIELPGDAQPGAIVPRPVTIIASAPARSHAGAWELVTPPSPTDGGPSYAYYGETLLNVAHNRWAGLTVWIVAKPSTCTSRVLHNHTVKIALTHVLRTATLQHATVHG
jgi:hypothetical protein